MCKFLRIASYSLHIFVSACFLTVGFVDFSMQARAEKDERLSESFNFLDTKVSKKLGESPEIITVYSSEYIKGFGFLTLDELLRSTPGFDSRNFSYYSTPATRGVANASLLMIDGTQLNSHLTNGFVANLGLDLSNYKRIEVMSGPGGVLWGAHSLLGVINLISFDGRDINGVRASASMGTFGYQKYGIKWGGMVRGIDLFVSSRIVLNRGQIQFIEGTTSRAFTFGGDYERGQDGVTSNKMDVFAEILGKIRFKNLQIFGRVPFSKDYFQVSEYGGLLGSSNGYIRSEDWVFHIAYEKYFEKIGLAILAKGYWYRNILQHNNRYWDANPFFPNGFGYIADYGLALKMGGLVEGSWRINLFHKRLDNRIIGGVDGMRESVSGAKVWMSDQYGVYGASSPLVLEEILDESGHLVRSKNPVGYFFSGYLHDEVRIFERVALAAGIRFNFSDSYRHSQLVMGSGVFEVFQEQYLKIKIVQGMRPPTMPNRFGQAPLSSPKGEFLNPDALARPLGPVTSSAYQFGYNGVFFKNYYGIKDFRIRGNLAWTSVSDIMELATTIFDPGTLYYVANTDYRIFSGESRLDLEFYKGHCFWLSYGFNKVNISNPTGGAQLGSVGIPAYNSGPHHIVASGIKYKPIKNISIVLRGNLSLGGDKSVLDFGNSQILSGTGKTAQSVTSSLLLLDAGLEWTGFQYFSIEAFAYNILDVRNGFWGLTNVFQTERKSGQVLDFKQDGMKVVITASMEL